MTEDDYRADLAKKEYREPASKTMDADRFNESHTHDYALYLLITQGEMTVEIEGSDGVETTKCASGETIEVPAHVVHTERAGIEGVTFWVAQK